MEERKDQEYGGSASNALLQLVELRIGGLEAGFELAPELRRNLAAAGRTERISKADGCGADTARNADVNHGFSAGLWCWIIGFLDNRAFEMAPGRVAEREFRCLGRFVGGVARDEGVRNAVQIEHSSDDAARSGGDRCRDRDRDRCRDRCRPRDRFRDRGRIRFPLPHECGGGGKRKVGKG
jgi:hypothetical protein